MVSLRKLRTLLPLRHTVINPDATLDLVQYITFPDGYRASGPSMRAYAERPDLGVVRLNKVLVHYTVGLGLGFVPQDLTAEQIKQKLRRLRVEYVVVQEGYAARIPVIPSLYTVLRTDAFQEVARISMTANYPTSYLVARWDDGFFPRGYLSDFVIYRATWDVPAGRVVPAMRLGVIGRSL